MGGLLSLNRLVIIATEKSVERLMAMFHKFSHLYRLIYKASASTILPVRRTHELAT